MDTLSILNYTITTSLQEVKGNKHPLLINTINPHSYCVAKNEAVFKDALQQSDVLLPDGTGIVWAAKLLNSQQIQRITGADLHKHLLEQTNQAHGKVFYLGAAPKTLQLIETKLKADFPNIEMASYSPPYKAQFSEADSAQMVAAVNAFKPDVLFVGMTAPKQEIWAFRHRDVLEANTIAAIGAVFDFYAGTVQRPGLFWQNLGLEWLPRLLREPKRLWRRNFVSTPCFLWDVLKAKLGWL